MNNTHETNGDLFRRPPFWYPWFYHTYWYVWLIGTALVVCSWAKIVPHAVGWIGFVVACAVALISYVLPRLAGIKPERHFVLDSRLIEKRGELYDKAMDAFQRGATLIHDGVAIGLYPDNEVACTIAAVSTTVDETNAFEASNDATYVFDRLTERCPEFRKAVEERTLRISIVSSFDEGAVEICRIVDGHLEWNPK